MCDEKKLGRGSIGLSTMPVEVKKSELLKKIEEDLLKLVYKEGVK